MVNSLHPALYPDCILAFSPRGKDSAHGRVRLVNDGECVRSGVSENGLAPQFKTTLD